MITPSTLARVKPGLRGEDADLERFLANVYDHGEQIRVSPDGAAQTELYPTSTRFDGDRT